MIVAFTGHRPDKLGGYEDNPIHSEVKSAIRAALLSIRPEKAISGMAVGIDQWAAEICVELSIPFVAALPMEGQEKRWPKVSQEKYRELLARACEVVYVCPPGYANWKFQKRNEFMVDNCDLLIVCWDGSPGGTGNCVKYAQKKKREMMRVWPRGGLL